uniref:Uncharacterized protein n=1 Tax=Lepeophtheirus salmonis TaxID=72036 RepID=A0A0K2VEC9_LEPSM
MYVCTNKVETSTQSPQWTVGDYGDGCWVAGCLKKRKERRAPFSVEMKFGEGCCYYQCYLKEQSLLPHEFDDVWPNAPSVESIYHKDHKQKAFLLYESLHAHSQSIYL